MDKGKIWKGAGLFLGTHNLEVIHVRCTNKVDEIFVDIYIFYMKREYALAYINVHLVKFVAFKYILRGNVIVATFRLL